MRVTRIAITGYRSLYEVNVEPGDLTVLTGPNNSGKTNFVEALDFLAEAYRHGLEVAISRKGGIENIIHRRAARTRRDLSFSVNATLDRDDLEYQYRGLFSEKGMPEKLFFTHQFTIVPLSQRIDADYQVSEESASIRFTPRSRPFFKLDRDFDNVAVDLDESRLSRNKSFRNLLPPGAGFYQQVYSRVRTTELMFGVAYGPLEAAYSRAMGRLRLYQLVPLEGRRPGVPTPNAEVDTHGANLPALVWFLRKNDEAAWRQVIQSMQGIMPELTDIKTDFSTDRRLELQFVERGVRRPWSAEDISDGTIQSLGMYTAIYDPRASLILIEEPENSIHPWIIRNFIDACRAADRQIILTTHSPALLSYLNPNEINLVWKRNGRTQIEPLPSVDPTVEATWEQGKVSLAEVIDSGLLPQSVPGGES